MTLSLTPPCLFHHHSIPFHLLDNLPFTIRKFLSYSEPLSRVFILLSFLFLILIFGLPDVSKAAKIYKPLIYEVKRGDTLGEIASHYQVSVANLRRWNNLTEDRIIEGQHLKLWPHSPPEWYVVRRGDTLSEIASQYNTSTSSLRRLNNISRNRIYPGQKIRLYKYHSEMDEKMTHVVSKGETLWDIAQFYNISVDDLRELNSLKGNKIIPGEVLTISEPSKERPKEEDQFEYIVKRGDNLSTIAQRFNVGLPLLRELNDLKSDRIFPGQKLQLRPSSLDEAVHIVRPGESLSTIAHKYNVKLADLVELNGIEGDKIIVGQKLRLRSTPASVHIVERGDALWEIARAYGMSVKEIKHLNGLASDRIYPGQELRLRVKGAEPLETYTVREGDYLGEIARLHRMSVSELKRVNGLRTSLLHPGDKLRVRPSPGKGREWGKVGEIDWDDLMRPSGSFRTIEAGNGPYYGMRPKATRQKSTKYYERQPSSPLENYRQAKRLWEAFEGEMSYLKPLSDTLSGWHFVLDPGHGGLDPGAVVETLDGNGNKIYVVEDEYVYDVALRVYVLLRLHGADVTMTLLSPNHLIRHSNPPTQTFVNEKNEVFNSYEINRKNRWKSWPVGGRNGNLSYRLDITQKAFKWVPRNRRIFLSFHADIDPTAPEAPMVLYYKSKYGKQEDLSSKKFAKSLLPALGAGSYVRGQSLMVLRGNPAAVSVILELRNMAYTDHVWALRYEQIRQGDAEKIVKGILDYVRKKT